MIAILAISGMLPHTLYAQDSTEVVATTKKDTIVFNGSITATNKGISTIPSSTLGKAATIFYFSFRKDKLSFEPELRFDMEDLKPWAFIFWWRYRIVENEKWRLQIGVNPSLSFKSQSIIKNGETEKILAVERAPTADIAPTYFLSNKVNLGLYYMYTHRLEGTTRNTHFLAFRTNVSKLMIEDYEFRVSPQIYYLRIDGQEGIYASSGVSVNKQNLPFTLSALFNRKINSNITIGDDYIWNVSLTYNFGNRYIGL
ncbi:hypothetical protein [Albibacterium bauzanense]|nr:hypothetical protein [Albibacterium bauzanense]